VDPAGDGGAGAATGLAADELGDLVGHQRSEPDAAMTGDPAGRGQQPGQFRAWHGRPVAQSADQHGAARQPGGQVTQQPQRGAVGPLQVVDDQHGGPAGRNLGDDVGDLLEQAELGAAVGHRWPALHAVARLHEPADLAGQPLLALGRGQRVEQGGDGLHPRPHRRGSVAVEAAAPDDQGTLPAGGGFFEQAGLADPGLAFDEDEAGAAGERGIHGLAHDPGLVDPADQRAPDRLGGGGGRRDGPEHLLVCGVQSRAGADAELLGKTRANRREQRQRLGLPPAGAQREDEARLDRLVQRRHRGGPS
jgi:hypothetical protein